MPRSTHTSSHGGGNDNEEDHDDPNDPLSRSVPRHPFLDGLVIVRRRRWLFFASVAHGPRAIVEQGTVVV